MKWFIAIFIILSKFLIIYEYLSSNHLSIWIIALNEGLTDDASVQPFRVTDLDEQDGTYYPFTCR
jgi:hypothetical protein